jgi:hypothetical protein
MQKLHLVANDVNKKMNLILAENNESTSMHCSDFIFYITVVVHSSIPIFLLDFSNLSSFIDEELEIT